MFANLGTKSARSYHQLRLLVVVGSFFGLAMLSNLAHAQTYRYMDDAGNLHWADSVSQVPARYRSQVVAPTPFAGLDTRGKSYKQVMAEYKRVEKEKKAEEAKKKKEEERANKRAAQEAKMKLKQEERQRKLEEKLKNRSKFERKSEPVIASPVKLPPGSGPSYGKIKPGEKE